MNHHFPIPTLIETEELYNQYLSLVRNTAHNSTPYTGKSDTIEENTMYLLGEKNGAGAIARKVSTLLPRIIAHTQTDIDQATSIDPALEEFRHPAEKREVVQQTYPGWEALAIHRFAHELNRRGAKSLAVSLAGIVRRILSIDIHPGAHLGTNVFIDHGVGVVIGGTTKLGSHAHIMSQVVLGALSGDRNKETNIHRRHPEIGHHFTAGTGAMVLGHIKLKDHVTVKAGEVLKKDARIIY